MSMPFPGMDPYLEHPIIWEGFHTRLIVAMANQLQPQLDPRYVASVEERVTIENPQHRVPDVLVHELPNVNRSSTAVAEVDSAVVLDLEPTEIRQKYLEILDAHNDLKLIAVIELISPTNKASGEGRRCYIQKQQEVLDRACHLIEIDLLRVGEPVFEIPARRLDELPPWTYLTCVQRWPRRTGYELYPRQLRQRLPRIAILLSEPDPDVSLDLQAAVAKCYDDARYSKRLRYHEPCRPALSPDDQAWADEQLRRFREQTPSNGQSAT